MELQQHRSWHGLPKIKESLLINAPLSQWAPAAICLRRRLCQISRQIPEENNSHSLAALTNEKMNQNHYSVGLYLGFQRKIKDKENY